MSPVGNEHAEPTIPQPSPRVAPLRAAFDVEDLLDDQGRVIGAELPYDDASDEEDG